MRGHFTVVQILLLRGQEVANIDQSVGKGRGLHAPLISIDWCSYPGEGCRRTKANKESPYDHAISFPDSYTPKGRKSLASVALMPTVKAAFLKARIRKQWNVC